jgi:hypothetical protein
MTLFRERLLASLVEQRAISKELVQKLLAWRHPGFSAHVGERIARGDEQHLEGFEAMDPLEWLARMSDHVPDPGQHRTLFYGQPGRSSG